MFVDIALKSVGIQLIYAAVVVLVSTLVTKMSGEKGETY